ncbi:M20/M25/M40 family metallo-hydrolase [Pseudaeromonas sharmana]|uniref:M20/M25/M40 family metallo-hydrolase n=1 Tax=Pseudaeromonas sharmana TaxID=328412 RepID=A0ABV8CRV8_9GAMM
MTFASDLQTTITHAELDVEKQFILEALSASMPEMIAMLRTVVADASWHQAAEDKQPFGSGVAACLDNVLLAGAALGFRTGRDDAGYYGWLDVGEGEPQLGVLCHVDQAPIADADAWFSDPLTLTERNGLLYGRGVQQSKGPLVAVIMALAVLVRHSMPLQQPIRIIIGTDGGQQGRCMARYLMHEPAPLLTLSPVGDAELVLGEKRRLQAYLLAPGSEDLTLACGGEFDWIPDRACYHGKQQKLLRKQLDVYGIPWLEQEHATLVLGQAAASGDCLHQGINAIARLCRGLNAIGYQHPALGFCALIVGSDPGIRALLGPVADVSGSLSCNLASLRLDHNEARIGLDLRVPVSVSYESISKQLKQRVTQLGWQYEEVHHLPPLSPSLSEQGVSLLRQCCQHVTGRPCMTHYSAGVSFARALPNTVPFGAILADVPDTRGAVNEHISSENLLMTAQIYALALMDLQKYPLATILGRQK